MKQLFLNLLLILSLSLTCNAKEVSHSFSFDESEFEFITNEVNGVAYTTLSHSKMAYEDINKAYDIPVLVKIFQIPINAANIEVSLSTAGKKLIKADCRLSPHQDCEETGSILVPGTSNQIGIPNCTPHAEMINHGYYDGDNRVIAISVCPFEYDGNKKQLYLNQICTVCIKYDINELLAEHQYSAKPIRRFNTGVSTGRLNTVQPQEFNNDIINICNSNDRSITQAFPLTAFDAKFRSYEYLIITSKDLVPNFRRLALLRKMQGYDVGIVAIEDIMDYDGLDDGDINSGIMDEAGKLRTYLIYAYEHWGTKYVLLGGNSDIIPVRYGTAEEWNPEVPNNYNDQSIPSDLYYSDLNSNWNPDNRTDGYGKESDDLDYYPELYVGRLLCSNAEEVDNYIDKLEVYELRPGNGDPSYLLSVTEAYQKDFVHHKNLINNRFDKFGFTYNDTFIETYTKPVSGKDIISSINENVCGVFTHHGHANPRSLHVAKYLDKKYHNIYALDWQTNLAEENYEDELNGFNNLKNRDKPFVLQSVGCCTAPLDHYHPFFFPNVYTLAQSFTLGRDYGGVVFLGNSRPGYYNSSYSHTSSDTYTVYIMETFWDLISKGVKTVGEAEAYCKSPEYSPNLAKRRSHAIRLTHHLIGDPLVKIHTQVPKSDSLDDREEIEKNYTLLGVPFNTPIFRQIASDEVGNLNDCAIYYMPNRDNRLPVFLDLSIPSFVFTGENVLYAENLSLGGKNDKVQFTGHADITFRSFGSVSIENIAIKDNATVTIITSGDVDLKNVTLSNNGTLRIRCNKCYREKLKDETGIEIYEYDNSNKRMSPHRETVLVEPMVVEGRRWEYIEESADYNGHIELRNFSVKIEGTATIDGQEYAVAYAYMDGADAPFQGIPYCYLRETSDGKVYARTNTDFDYLEGDVEPVDETEFLDDGAEFLLADFNDFYASQTFYPAGLYGDERIPLESYNYTNAVNTLKVWQLINPYFGRELRLVEKVGYVWPDRPCGLLTPLYVFSTGDRHEGWLYLQRVCDADGSTIYEIDNKYSSTISVSSDDSPVSYYDLQGRKLNQENLSPGIYIRRQSGISSKILIQ